MSIRRELASKALLVFQWVACSLAIGMGSGCRLAILTPALWEWSERDDIGHVSARGAALATREDERDRIFLAIGGMVSMESGNYEVEIPNRIREDVPRWRGCRWLDSNERPLPTNGGSPVNISCTTHPSA